MELIGKYRGYECYRIERETEQYRVENDKLYFVYKPREYGYGMYLWGENVGFCDKALCVKWFQVSEETQRLVEEYRNKKTPMSSTIGVPACVAENANTDKDGSPIGADLFFANLAKDIEDTLKSVALFDEEKKKWEFK